MRVFGAVRPGIADVLTIGNGLCGVAAITVVVATPWSQDAAGEVAVLRIVAMILLVGVVLDVCDGAVARARGGTALGPHLDSLADIAAFGVAPAVAVAGLAIRHATVWESIAVGIGALVYGAGALIRLADFDAVRSRDPDFLGMPSPLAAISALAVGLLALSPWFTAVGLAIVGGFMVIALRYPRSGGWGLVAEAVAIVVAVVGIVGVMDVRIPAAGVLVATLFVVPVVYGIVVRRRSRAASAPAARTAPAERMPG